jgi:hypothetical protein
MPESLGQIRFSDANRTAERNVLVPFNEVESEQIHQTRFIDADLRRPIEAFQRALFIKAGIVQTELDPFVIPSFDLIGEYELKEVRVIDLVLTRKGKSVR